MQLASMHSLEPAVLQSAPQLFFAQFFLVTLLNLFTMSKSKDPRYFLLDTVPTDDDTVITGARLPTARQVLLCFLAHHSSEGNTRRQAANLTVQTVLPFYERARIMTLAQHKMAEEVLKVFDEMKSLLKIDHAHRQDKTNVEKFSSFKDKLNRTMKFWPRNVLEKITNEEDKEFLVSMMTDRKATMGSVDSVLHSTEKKRLERKKAEEMRVEKEEMRKQTVKAACSSFCGDDSEESEEIDHQQMDKTFVPEPHDTPQRSHKRVVKTGTPAFWPHDILRSPEVVETAVRNKITPTQLASLTHSMIKATSGDHTKVNLHYKTAYK